MSSNAMGSRIQILDSYRTIAILVVIIYHYYYRWGPLLGYEGVKWFEIGKYGVHFFFVISGFVIHYTLQNKESIWSFYHARLVRLLPTMIIFSSVTYLFFQIFPLDIHPRFDTSWSDLLANWTFVNPVVLNKLFDASFTYVEPAYWSLWFEVRFYLWVGLIFFLSKKYFLRNWLLFTLVLNLWMHFPIPGLSRHLVFYINNLLPVEWVNYFSLGVVFYLIYAKAFTFQLRATLASLVILESLRIWQFGLLYNAEAFIIILIFFLPFSLRLPLPGFLRNAWMVKTGQASYGLYLIHQNVGIALIYFILSAFDMPAFIPGLLVTILFIILSIISFIYVEKPIVRFLNNRSLLRKSEGISSEQP